MERNTTQWTVSIPPRLSKEALQIALEESRTKSELVREALRHYLENKTFERTRKRIHSRLEDLGIRTEADIEQLIDEGRA